MAAEGEMKPKDVCPICGKELHEGYGHLRGMEIFPGSSKYLPCDEWVKLMPDGNLYFDRKASREYDTKNPTFLSEGDNSP